MLTQAISLLSMLSVGLPVWLHAPDPHEALPPLTYQAAAPQHPARLWLLADDPRGDGRRVTVLGDLASAAHVAVLVPGASHDLTTYDDPAGPLDNARNLYERLRLDAPDVPVAVLAWLGYDAPEGIDREVARSDRAVAGAAELARLADVLPAGSHVTWLCHSYGTVVCGHAARAAAPDDLVLLASPGTDARSADELGADQVWAARAPGDAIRFVPSVRVGNVGHGTDPMSPSFGATVLDPGAAQGHSEYFDPSGSLLEDLAAIVVDGTPEMRRG